MIISRIDESNKAIFESLMPGELFQKLNLPSVFAIGAIAGEGEEKKQVAGVLVFSVDEGSSGEENLIVATIMLRSLPAWRSQGIPISSVRCPPVEQSGSGTDLSVERRRGGLPG